jgi:7-keto-8-aminopelargonate synthetase-like enzyme
MTYHPAPAVSIRITYENSSLFCCPETGQTALRSRTIISRHVWALARGGTRNIAGNNHPLLELERGLADLHRKESALVFTFGYVSNETGISTIAKLMPNCLILSDAWKKRCSLASLQLGRS